MGLGTRLARNRRQIASGTVVSLVVGTVVALSLNYDGMATADVELNDGGVWVANNHSVLVGRLNHPVGKIDASLAASGEDVSLLQRADVVFMHDHASGTLQNVNTAEVANAGGAVQLAGDSDVQLGEGTLGVLGSSGDLRVVGLDELAVLEDTTTEPLAQLGEGSVQAVADGGTAFGLNVLDGQLYIVTPAERLAAREAGTELGLEPIVLGTDHLEGTDEVQLTAIGDAPVILAYTEDGPAGERLELLRPDTEPIDLSGFADQIDLASAVLQRPSAGGTDVIIAAQNALVRVPLDGEDVEDVSVVPIAAPGVPTAPVQVAGCVHGAWAGETPTYLRACGDAEPAAQDIPDATAGDALEFQVNRNIVVLNNLENGNAWMLENTLVLVDNWEDVTPPSDDDSEEEEESIQELRDTVPLDREADNRDPVAKPDSYGLRAGNTIIIPLLENDSDPDGDLLTVGAFDQLPESFGTVEEILGGRALQIRVDPDATGTESFTYTADDGRGGSAEATVDLEVVPLDRNEPPEQVREIKLTVVSGESGQVNILDDVRDPEGDAVFVAQAAPSNNYEVVASPNGLVTITDRGITTGPQEVVLTVSDGRDRAEVVVQLMVEPAGPVAPEAVFDFTSTFVDEEIVVRPLTNDIDPNGKPLRLTSVSSVSGATVRNDLAAGTFTFTAERTGDYYLTYVIADDDGLTATGLVRVSVRATSDAPPVAVSDVALLPEGGTVLVDVLENDTDPGGGVIAVQQIDIPAASGLQVSIIDHRILRITATRILSDRVTFEYTVSNGNQSATGEVMVLPMDIEGRSQPPVAIDDSATVRAGDHLTIPALSNDHHPNGLEFTLDSELVSAPANGLMFTVDGVVRFEAPDEPQTITASYQITDEAGQSDSATITIYVQARTDESNSPPIPRDVESRAFSGERIRIPISLYGIDSDGDSVQLLGVDSAPELGRVVEVGPSWLDYQAFNNQQGTDTFTYAVRDRLGAIATASVTVGVVEPPASNRDPVAIADEIVVRPGRAIQAEVLGNDIDPDGDLLIFGNPAVVDAAGTDAAAPDGFLHFRSPDEEGTYLIQYAVTDRHGGSDIGTLTVTVDRDGVPQPPVAVDDVVPSNAILGVEQVDVVVLENDTDSDGSREALQVSVPAGNSTARVGPNNTVQVDLLPTRQVVTYQITDEDGLVSYAFIDVPGLEDTGPVLRPDAADIVVDAGVRFDIALEDYVVSLSGAPVQLADATTVRATNSDGSEPVVSATALQYTSDPNYAGPATLTFEVTDAADINADGILTSVLTLNITVRSDGERPPVFRDSSLEAEAGGEEVTLDLTRLADDLDTDVALLTYDIEDVPDGFDAEITDGYILHMTADEESNGRSGNLRVSVTDGDSEPVQGTITLTGTSSNRPLITANDDDAGEVHQGEPTTLNVVGNDSNPFPGQAREVTGVEVLEGDAVATASGEEVTFTPAETYVGRIVLVYTVADVTGDEARRVQAQVTAAVLGKPEVPAPPRVEAVGNGEVRLSWTPPNDNGSPITGYDVSGPGVTQACASTTCTITGLNNGSTYTFTVTATNDVGPSDPSPASAEAVPDVKPEAPAAPTLTFGDGELDVRWLTPRNEGTPITGYDLEISPAPGGSDRQAVTGTSYTWSGLTNGTAYAFRVRAHNSAPDPSDWSAWSQPEIPSGPPAQPAAPSAERVETPAGGQVSVSWTEPDNNGDSIDTYSLTPYRDGVAQAAITFSGGQFSHTHAADNGHDYTFTVTATNRAGTSEVSASSNSVRSFGAPGAPTAVSAVPTGSNQQAEVRYTPPGDNGQAIIRYEYSLSGAGASALPSSGLISVPQNGSSYTVRVRACNTYCGAWSLGSAAFSTYGPPGAPAVTGSADLQTVTFSWTAPGGNGATIASSEYRIDGGAWTPGATSGSAPVTGAWNQSHTIEVRVVNDHGQVGPIATTTLAAESDPTPPPVASAVPVGGMHVKCDADGVVIPQPNSGCPLIAMRYENFPPGEYTVTFQIEGSTLTRTYTTTLSGSSVFTGQAWHGDPTRIRWLVRGPVNFDGPWTPWSGE